MPTFSRTTIVLGSALLIAGIALGFLIARSMESSERFGDYVESRDAAPDKEVFDRNFEAMTKWLEHYKRDNPGATDEDARRAFEDLWKG